MICEGAIRRMNWLLLMMMCRVSTFDFGGHQNSNGQIYNDGEKFGILPHRLQTRSKGYSGRIIFKAVCSFHCWPLYMNIAGIHF
jgi:hypothetical protein